MSIGEAEKAAKDGLRINVHPCRIRLHKFPNNIFRSFGGVWSPGIFREAAR